MVNKYRGEVELILGQNTYILCPTFSNVVELESHLNQGLFAIAKDFKNSDFKVNQVVAILYYGLSDKSDFKHIDEFAELINQQGYLKYINQAMQFLKYALGFVDE